jgi:predicted Zn-dependent peptidase
MVRVKIDQLDLKKRKEDLERGRTQQVHIRLDERGGRQREEELDDSWGEPVEEHLAAAPGEIAPPPPSFLNKIGKRLSKLKEKEEASIPGERDYYKEDHSQQVVRVRAASSGEIKREPFEDEKENHSYSHQARANSRVVVNEPIKSFEQRLAEKIRAEENPDFQRSRQEEPRQEEVHHEEKYREERDGERYAEEREEEESPVEEPEVEEEEVEPEVDEPITVTPAPVAKHQLAAAQSENTPSFRRGILSNGLKIITAPILGTKTITTLMIFGTGSKYESLSVNGLSHFLEHMFFKGTKRRPTAQKISSDLDALGCEYNAFTTKEYTGYYIKVDSSKVSPALDILSDMLLNPEFSAAEINKERGVIIEEINMYHENPMMYIEDVFESCLYGDTPAGREIIGPKSNIELFKRQNFVNYYSAQYGANSAVLCLAGDVDEKTERLAARYFSKMPRSSFMDKIRTPDVQRAPAVKTHYKEGDQAIISLGFRAYDAYHEDKVIIKVMAVILGGSMSSRMFSEVREKRGLAYFVHTTAETYTDTGYLTTQAGIPVGKEEQAIKVILGEYKKLKSKPVSKEELKRAKDLIKGRTIINFEASDNVANWYGQKAILKENLLTPEEYFDRIDKVKVEDIRRVAKDIFTNERLNLAMIGPFQDSEEFLKILKV